MTIAPCSWASPATSTGCGRLDEAGLREVRRMDAEDDRRPPVRERRLEVGGASPVRRADLDQPGARSPDDLRDADAAADLDQLAARDRDPVLAGQPDRERRAPRRC